MKPIDTAHMRRDSDSAPNKVALWLPSVLPIVFMCLAGLAAYYDLKEKYAVQSTEVVTLRAEGKALDKYQRYMQRQIEVNDRSIVVIQTKQNRITTEQEKLETKVDSILSKLEGVGNALTKIQTQLEHIKTK